MVMHIFCTACLASGWHFFCRFISGFCHWRSQTRHSLKGFFSERPMVKLAELGLVFLLAAHLFGGLRLMALEGVALAGTAQKSGCRGRWPCLYFRPVLSAGSVGERDDTRHRET